MSIRIIVKNVSAVKSSMDKNIAILAGVGDCRLLVLPFVDIFSSSRQPTHLYVRRAWNANASRMDLD